MKLRDRTRIKYAELYLQVSARGKVRAIGVEISYHANANTWIINNSEQDGAWDVYPADLK